MLPYSATAKRKWKSKGESKWSQGKSNKKEEREIFRNVTVTWSNSGFHGEWRRRPFFIQLQNTFCLFSHSNKL